MSSEPIHLAKFDRTIDNIFLEMEELYRRSPQNRDPYEGQINDFVLDFKWDSLLQGLSINRSRYSTPIDAMWSISEDQNNTSCNYQLKKGIVFRSYAKYFPTSKDTFPRCIFSLEHSPTNCNISHCDISGSNIAEIKQKPIQRDIKAYLSSLFTLIDEKEL